ncbi:MAG: hypothetical protein RDA78_00045 [Roseibium sp.]|uniref:hypothetical protein n=1 Tax=Roseibium sp. TaxID=1936156 RepID=UPI003D9C5612
MLRISQISRKVLPAFVVATGVIAGTWPAFAQSATIASPAAAFTAAQDALDAAWQANGLAFVVATFTQDGGTAYGQYTPRNGSVFQDDDVLSIYAEPVGYGFIETDGVFAFDLTASYRLLNSSGQVLAEQENFAEFSGEGRSKQRELAAALSFQFSGLPAGDYELETRFKDQADGKEAGFTLSFSIAEPN